jgi:hypothetical protein
MNDTGRRPKAETRCIRHPGDVRTWDYSLPALVQNTHDAITFGPRPTRQPQRYSTPGEPTGSFTRLQSAAPRKANASQLLMVTASLRRQAPAFGAGITTGSVSRLHLFLESDDRPRMIEHCRSQARGRRRSSEKHRVGVLLRKLARGLGMVDCRCIGRNASVVPRIILAEF